MAVSRELLQDQIALLQRGEPKLVTALTPTDIGYWARRHNVALDNCNQAMIDGWQQADQEIKRTRELVQRQTTRKAV